MVTDILMNTASQLLIMGLPPINQSPEKLLVATKTFPKSAVLGNTVGYARVIGLCLVLCVGSYECWMMILGCRAMDVMKLLRIAGLSICITYSSWICQELARPGKTLEVTTKQMASSKNKEVAALGLKVAQKQSDYPKRLRQVQDSIETAKQVQTIGEDAHWWDKLIYNMGNLGMTTNNYAQRATVAAETKVLEWVNDVIRFIGELISQTSYYGTLVARRIFMAVLATFAPIMFTPSIAPPWNSAWSQWISKYLSLSLWGFVTYMCLYYIDFILMYNPGEDLSVYGRLLQGQANSWGQIGALGIQGIGSNCMYAMGMLVGAYITRFIPEAASRLISRGVSSSADSAVGGVVTGAVGGVTGSAASTGVGIASVATPMTGAAVSGTVYLGAASMAGAVSGANGYSDGGVATMVGVMGGAASGTMKEAKHMFKESSAGKAASKMGNSMRDSYNGGKQIKNDRIC